MQMIASKLKMKLKLHVGNASSSNNSLVSPTSQGHKSQSLTQQV